VAEKLARERQLRVVQETAGAWDDQGRADATDEIRLRREAWAERLRSEE
jgi:hypothetical protein